MTLGFPAIRVIEPNEAAYAIGVLKAFAVQELKRLFRPGFSEIALSEREESADDGMRTNLDQVFTHIEREETNHQSGPGLDGATLRNRNAADKLNQFFRVFGILTQGEGQVRALFRKFGGVVSVSLPGSRGDREVIALVR